MAHLVECSNDFLTEELISVLTEHCRDSSLMIRKLVIVALTSLVKMYPDDDLVIRQWVIGIFPQILDVEQKSAEKAHECLWECLFGNLVRYSDMRNSTHQLPWKILIHSEKEMMTKYLSRACGSWAKQGLLTPAIMSLLKTHVHTSNNDHAWLLLSLITVHIPLHDPHFVMEYFNSSIHTPEGVSILILE